VHFNLSSFLQMRFNFYLMQKLGWSFTFVYVFLLVKFYFLIKRKEKHKIALSVQSVFAKRKDPADIRSLKKAICRGIFFHYYEKIINAFSPAETLRTFFETHVDIEGRAALDNALEAGKGVLLVTGHFGGVEYMPLYLGFKKYPISMVARFTSEKLRSMSQEQAARFGIKIIDPDQTPNVMQAILASLRENRIVITQCDEIDEWRLSRQDKIYFLGKRTFLDKTLNVLSKRAGAPVVFGIMHRSENHRYKFIATSWKTMSQQFQGSGRPTMAEVILKFMERYIYIHPEEWYQWKKYPAIETIPAVTNVTSLSSSTPLLEPSFSEVA